MTSLLTRSILFGAFVSGALLGASCQTTDRFAGSAPPSGGGPDAAVAPADGGDAGPTSVDAGTRADTGTPVDVAPPATSAGALLEAIASDRPADPEEFHRRWPTKYLTQLPYDPLQATNLDLIAASSLGLSAAEQALIARNGFVISARQSFPTFFYGYKSIYADHLPLYVSLDSVLHAVHRSYDAALLQIELASLIPTLGTLLTNMHGALAAGAGADLPPEVRADVDVYLTVARRLLGQTATPVAGGDPAAIAQLLELGQAATAVARVGLFGVEREVDFTQLKPRGHYANDSRLQPYFRSMMWLGRTDLRFLEFDPFAPAGTPPLFQRRQFLTGLLLATLAQGADLDRWRDIDEVLRGFVGESDNMTVADFPKLQQLLGAATAADLAGLPDETIAQALLDGGFGIQRIASQILVVPARGANAPLDRVFLFFGQRFVIDSAVFSEVVFDRVRGIPRRMMPDPLDIAFAALGNNAAAPLLDGEMRTYPGYLGKLHDMRRLVDEHRDDFWGGSLYTAWLSALRGFAVPSGDPTAIAGLPAVMKTEPWARRVISSQLASWAELRHDTLLYAKQSYTAIPACVFPDAYVDPYPDAWAGIVRLARIGQAVTGGLPASASSLVRPLAAYFTELETAASMLQAMAEAERAGQPFTAEQMAFINEAIDQVRVSVGSGSALQPRGWYPRLFFQADEATKVSPTIADVHSNPDPEAPGVLHVATGFARLMVVTADTCNGPRAYAGLVSSYFEHIPPGYQRLDDQQWATRLNQGPALPDESWVEGLIAR